MDRLLTMVAENITRHGDVLWEWVNGKVVRIIISPEVIPMPTEPSIPPIPWYVPEPTPLLAIILSLVVTSIVAGLIVWYFGYREVR